MEVLLLILGLASSVIAVPPDNDTATSVINITDPNKDMYVIHAMVYQVGIITNKTDDETSGNMTGNEETLTLYHTNGSNIDLSGLPSPLLTNVTAQRIVGVAPAQTVNPTYGMASLPWASLEQLASLPPTTKTAPDKQVAQSRATRDSKIGTSENETLYAKVFSKRSTNSSKENNEVAETTPVKIIKGAAVIPQEVGVQSLVIPSLLSLNNNFTEIPVPIPNTSIVQYAKVNTLIHAP